MEGMMDKLEKKKKALEYRMEMRIKLDIKTKIKFIANELFLIYRESPNKESWNIDYIKENTQIYKSGIFENNKEIDIVLNYLENKNIIKRDNNTMKISPLIIDYIDPSIY